MERCKEMKGLV